MAKFRPNQSRVSSGINSQRADGSSFGGDGGLVGAGEAIVSTAGVVQKSIDDSEMSSVQLALSQQRVDALKSLNDSSANMTAGGAGYTDSVLSDMDKMNGQRAGDYRSKAARNALAAGQASIRADMAARAMGLEVQARGTKAVADYSTASQNNQSVVTQDPSQLESVLKAQLAFIESLPLSAPNKAKFSESAGTDLAEAAVRGAIRANPALARQNLKDGVYSKYFDSDETKSLIGEANTAESAIRIQDERDEQDAKDKQVALEKATKRQLLLAVNSPNPPTLQEILENPDVSNADAVFFMNHYKSVNEDGETKTEEGYVSALIARTFLPVGAPGRINDTDQIYELVGAGVLSLTDANRVAGVFDKENAVINENEKALRTTTRKSVSDMLRGTNALLGMKDPIGNRLYNSWQVEGMEFVERTLAAKPETDPNEFYDPNSKLWLGHLAEKYKRSTAQILADTFSGLGIPQSPDGPSKVKASDYSDKRAEGMKQLQEAWETGKISLFDRDRIAREKGFIS